MTIPRRNVRIAHTKHKQSWLQCRLYPKMRKGKLAIVYIYTLYGTKYRLERLCCACKTHLTFDI